MVKPTTPEVRLVDRPVETLLDLPENLTDPCDKPRLDPTPGADDALHNAELEAYIAKLQASIDECDGDKTKIRGLQDAARARRASAPPSNR